MMQTIRRDVFIISLGAGVLFGQISAMMLINRPRCTIPDRPPPVQITEKPVATDTWGNKPYCEQVMRVTAYCPCEKCCGTHADGVTASGYRIRAGDKFCASPLPFLSLLEIEGYGTVPVLDRGGAIKERCVDVFFSTHQEALEWGVRHINVKVYQNKKEGL